MNSLSRVFFCFLFFANCAPVFAAETARPNILFILMDDMGLKSSRHALAEHHEIEEGVEKVQKSDPKSLAWQEHARALSKRLRHHLKEEESKFFQVSGKILGPRKKTTLARRYLKECARLKKVLMAA